MECFGYTYPNYDVLALSNAVCLESFGCNCNQTRFYTGVPPASEDERWHGFWTAKLRAMRTQGIETYHRLTRNGKEKGIDVRLALDVIGLAHRNQYDVAIIFSQDQDLSEIMQEITTIAREQDRWIKIACAYPLAAHISKRGTDRTEWIRIPRSLYDACIDPRDYRPRPRTEPAAE